MPRRRPRVTLGAINLYGGEGPPLRIFTLNVTVLTISRLSAVLDKAAEEQAGIIALRETNHPWHGFRWATKIVT